MAKRIAQSLGKTPYSTHLDTVRLEGMKRFAKLRNEAVDDVVERAVRRFMAYLPLPPRRPVATAEPAKPTPAKKAAKSKGK